MLRIRRTIAGVAFAIVQAAPSAGFAQEGWGPAPQWEARLDATAATVPALHAGLGVHMRAGYYARVAVAGMAGAAWDDGTRRSSQRVDASVRFLLDPFGERPHGLYGGAGLTARHDAGESWRGSLLLVVGLEGAARGWTVPAVEVALGGGVRVAMVLRGRRRASGGR